MKKVGKKKPRSRISGNRQAKSPPAAIACARSPGREMVQLLMTGLSAYLVLAFFTPWAGVAGTEFRTDLLEWIGVTAFFLILLPMMVVAFLNDPFRKPTALHLGYLASWIFSISLFFDVIHMGGTSEQYVEPLLDFFGKGGTLVFASTLLAIATLLILNVPLKKMVEFLLWVARIPVFVARKIARLTAGRLSWQRPKPGILPEVTVQSEPVILVGEMEPAENAPATAHEVSLPEPVSVPGIEAEPMGDCAPSPEAGIQAFEVPPEESGESVAAIGEPSAQESPSLESEPSDPPAPAKASEEKALSSPRPGGKSKKSDSDSGRYALPGLNMLEEADPRKDKGARIDPKDYSRLLEETLSSFGIEATVVHVERGPTVTRYELQPAKGVKVSKIVALTDDLALALAAISLRIEAPIPGKSAIGIEIPNSSVAMVYFRDLLSSPVYQENPLRTILALGKDITGKPIFTELRKMPHLLIAGATGSGKTVCINTLIASILFKATPQEVQFVMIDPKRVELTIYDGIPHLIREVVTDAKEAAKVLVDVLAIMDDRYNLFKEARVRNLEEYNRARPESALPYLVVLIDELADLMMLAAAAVESSIARLTALARAAGIHLIVATQRPSVDVITGIIKANIPSRIAFAVSSIADSRTILDTGGSEKLLGRGDMLFAPIDAMKPIRLQGAYVSLSEIESLVSFWSRQPAPQNLVQLPEITIEEEEEESQGGGDELYSQAKEIILRTGQASVSTLQRKLKIGYARAGRLMDLMEKRGVVGPADGAKPRKILIPNPFRAGN